MNTKSFLLTIILSFLIFHSSTISAQTTDSIITDTIISDSVKQIQDDQGSYVVLGGDSLLQINVNFGPYSTEERAAVISGRFQKLVINEKNIITDSFKISNDSYLSVIVYKNIPLVYIGAADAKYYNKTREQLANEYLQIIKKTFDKLIDNSSQKSWIAKIGFTMLALLGLFIIFFLINKSFAWINLKLVHYEKGIKRKRKNILKYIFHNKSDSMFLIFSKIVKIALIVLILFLYLPLLFSFLPWTEGLAQNFYGYIADPVTQILIGLKNAIPNVISIIVIIVIVRYLLHILNYVVRDVEEQKLKLKGFHHDWARPTFNLLKIIIYALSFVFIVQYLPQSKAFQGVSIFVGVLFTLGSTSAIANMIAGIVITYMRPFMIGDRVKIDNTVGDVIEKNLLVTRIRTTKNEDVTIPNATIINAHLWNYSKSASSVGLILHPTVTIGYDVPSKQVIELLLKAAKNTKDLTREFKPFVLQKSLNDFYVEYELNVYTKQPKKMPYFYSELNKSILREFNEVGVEILSPHYNAYRDGNESTIPNEPKPPATPVEKVIDKITGK